MADPTVADDTEAAEVVAELREVIPLFAAARELGRLDAGTAETVERMLREVAASVGEDYDVIAALVDTESVVDGLQPTDDEPTGEQPTGKQPTGEQPDTDGLAPGENIDLRDYPPVALTRSQRRDINERAVNLLQKERIELTAEDIDTLRQYTGQGGLGADTGAEAVRKLNEHYTSYGLIEAIWTLLQNAGYEDGAVLEPGAGIGNFAGFAPEGVDMLLIERSGISARIAQLLYPGHEVVNKSLAFVDWTPYRLTAAVGNVPFGNYSITPESDPFAGLNAPIHDYFILKAIEQVEPGSPIALITSTGTMDKKTPDMRRAMMQRAAHVASFRLPSTMFKANADTLVTTDLIVLQKRPERLDAMDLVEREEAIRFVDTVTRTVRRGDETYEVSLSRYYDERPDRVLGTMEAGLNSRFVSQWGVEGDPARAIAQVEEATLRFPYDFPEAQSLYRFDEGERSLREAAKQYPGGALFELGGTYYEAQRSSAKPIQVPPAHEERLRSALRLLDRLAEYTSELARNGADADATPVKELVRLHVEQYGLPSEDETLADLLRYDPRLPKLTSLVRRNEDTGQLVYADLLSASALYNERYREGIEDTEDLAAVTTYLRAQGEDLTPQSYASVWKGGTATEEEVEAAMEADPNFFRDPQEARWVFRYDYLTGNVREKLRAAREADLDANAEALEAALPEQATVFDIALDPLHINTYLTEDHLEAWLADEINTTRRNVSVNRVASRESEQDRFFTVDGPRNARDTNRGWGAEPYSKLLHLYLNERRIARKPVGPDGNILNKPLKKATSEEKQRANRYQAIWQERMQRELPRDFQRWVRTKASEAVREDIADRYNALYSAHANPPFDGSTFSVRGLSDTFAGIENAEIYPHNTIVAEKMLWNQGGGDCHDVGSGKTFAAIITAMAAKQRGMLRKPLFVVPGQVLRKWQNEMVQLFPDAKTLAIELAGDRRAEELARAQLYDWDAIFIPDHAFKRLPLSPDEQRKRLQRRKREFERAINSEVVRVRREAGSKEAKRLQKRLAKRFAKIESTLENQIEETERDDVDIYFDELGVDALFFDEAHLFKNALGTPKGAELGIAKTQPSQRAEDALQKSRWIHEQTGGHNVWILTATPVQNSPIEVWHMLNLCAPNLLKKYEIEYLDNFIDLFVRSAPEDRRKVSGDYKREQAVVGYRNLPEMRRIIDEALDVKSYDQLQQFYEENPGYGQPFSRPEDNTLVELIEPSEIHELLFEDIEHRAEIVIREMKNRRFGEELTIRDNFLVITSDGSKMATDLRVYSDQYAGFDHESLKIRPMVQNAVAYYRGDRVPAGRPDSARENPARQTVRGGVAVRGRLLRDERQEGSRDNPAGDAPRNQIIFVDAISLKGQSSGSFHKAIKKELEAAGIPGEEIAIINGGMMTVTEEDGTVREISPSADEKQDLKLNIQERFNEGQYRVIIGNQTIQEGMNLDRWGVATHHLDIPYRPADLQQRNGRMVRQGNQYEAVDVIYYLMEGSFDEYRLQLVRQKAGWIDELFYGAGRESEGEGDSQSLTYEEMQAATAKDPRVKTFFEALGDSKRLQDEVASLDSEIGELMASLTAAETDLRERGSRVQPTIETEETVVQAAEATFPESPDALLNSEQIRFGGMSRLADYLKSGAIKDADEAFRWSVELSVSEQRAFGRSERLRIGLRVPSGNPNGRVRWTMRFPEESRRNVYGTRKRYQLVQYAETDAGGPLWGDEDRSSALLATQDDFYAYYGIDPSEKPEDQPWEDWKAEIGMTNIERWRPVLERQFARLFWHTERRWIRRSPARVENLRQQVEERRKTVATLQDELGRARQDFDRKQEDLQAARETVTTLREVVNQLSAKEYGSRGALYERLNEIAPRYGVEPPVEMRIVGDPDSYPAQVPAFDTADAIDLLVDEGGEEERPNPASTTPIDYTGSTVQAFIGYADQLRTDQTAIDERHLMFTTPAMDRLVLVPESEVATGGTPPADEAVTEAFSDWHQMRPKGTGYRFEVPDATPAHLGTAERIEYSSDKIVQPGDEGQWHDYYHHFDEGAHPVVRLGSVLVVAPGGTLEINTRGKLGIVN